MNIRIHSQMGQIGIQQSMGQFHIQGNFPTATIKTQEPELRVQLHEAVINIDQQQCFAEAGLKNDQQMVQKYAQMGKQAAIRATVQAVNEGREMLNFHNGAAIPRIAKRRTTPNVSVNTDVMPKSKPNIHVQIGEVQGSSENGSISITPHLEKLQINYQQGNLNIYLDKKNYFSVEYVV